MRINVNRSTEIAAAITAVHPRAQSHTYSDADIAQLAEVGESKLAALAIPKTQRPRAMLIGESGAQMPNAYRGDRVVTRAVLVRGASDWFLVRIEAKSRDNRSGGATLALTPLQDQIAIAATRSKYLIGAIA